MSKWTISDPGSAGGFGKEEHLTHLVFFVEPRPEEVPKFSGEGQQTAAKCDYAVCTDCQLVLSDPPLVFGDALVPALLGRGELVAGRLILGKARPGRNAPYVLDPLSDVDRTALEGFLDKHAVRMPSGKIVIETPAGAVADSEII